MTTLTPLVLCLLLQVIPNIRTQVSITPINNYVYTSQLGPARVLSSFHKFIHYINLTDLNTEIEHNEHVLLSLQRFIENKSHQNNYVKISANISLQNIGFERLISNSLNQITEIKNRISAFNPSRIRRGLINPIGNLHKFLFGTMDNDDRESISKALSVLEENQFKITKRIQIQTSVTTQLLEHYNKTVSSLVFNQNSIVKQLEKILNQISYISREHDVIIKVQNAFSQLYMNLDKIKEFVMTIENAISFAHLKELHPAILPKSELILILQQLQSTFNSEQLIHLNDISNYYRIFSINVNVIENIIYFIIYAPIFDTKEFSLFHSFPIPWKNQTLVIPQPYTLMSLTSYMVLPESCPQIEGTYICKGHPQAFDDGCEISIISNGNSSKCPVRTVILQSNIVEQISQDEIIVVPKKDVKLPFKCNPGSGIHLAIEPSILKVPEDCQVTIAGQKFLNSKELPKAIKFALPKIDVPRPTENSNTGLLQLKHITLDEIAHLHKTMQDLPPLDINPITESHQTVNIGLTTVVMGILMFALILYIYKKKPSWFQNRKPQEQTPGDVELQATPEVQPRQGGVMYITSQR